MCELPSQVILKNGGSNGWLVRTVYRSIYVMLITFVAISIPVSCPNVLKAPLSCQGAIKDLFIQHLFVLLSETVRNVAVSTISQPSTWYVCPCSGICNRAMCYIAGFKRVY